VKAPRDGSPPAGAVVVDDGDCVLCAWSVRFIASHDTRGRLRFTTSGSDVGRALLAHHGLREPGGPGTMVFVEGGRAFVRSTAALRIARRLPWPWRALSVGLVVPAPVRDVVYRIIARYRYRWFGRHDACAVAPPEVRDRLL
jgi:predicted DCC family thiol-disulfide oxidoreductase YuxK